MLSRFPSLLILSALTAPLATFALVDPFVTNPNATAALCYKPDFADADCHFFTGPMQCELGQSASPLIEVKCVGGKTDAYQVAELPKSVKSVKVRPGYSIRLCQDVKFGGDCRVVGIFEDKISDLSSLFPTGVKSAEMSVRPEAKDEEGFVAASQGITSKGPVCFFKGENFTGERYCPQVDPNNLPYREDFLTNNKQWNDGFKSVKLENPNGVRYAVMACEHVLFNLPNANHDFQQCGFMSQDVPKLADLDLADKISEIRIYKWDN
jgi:hypothetical protein